jgi:hypothetical protein
VFPEVIRRPIAMIKVKKVEEVFTVLRVRWLMILGKDSDGIWNYFLVYVLDSESLPTRAF